MVRLADRRKLFEGDISPLQEEALQWLMLNESEESVQAERERMKYTILAGNVHLWKELYGEDDEQEDDGEVEWITPSSLEDMEKINDILAQLEAATGGEDFTAE